MVLLRYSTVVLLFSSLYFAETVAGFGFGPGSPDCPEDKTMNEIKVPDPNDCTKYSKCGYWFSAKFSCKPGEHFSPVELKCMDPCAAGCDPAYDLHSCLEKNSPVYKNCVSKCNPNCSDEEYLKCVGSLSRDDMIDMDCPGQCYRPSTSPASSITHTTTVTTNPSPPPASSV